MSGSRHLHLVCVLRGRSALVMWLIAAHAAGTI